MFRSDSRRWGEPSDWSGSNLDLRPFLTPRVHSWLWSIRRSQLVGRRKDDGRSEHGTRSRAAWISSVWRVPKGSPQHLLMSAEAGLASSSGSSSFHELPRAAVRRSSCRQWERRRVALQQTSPRLRRSCARRAIQAQNLIERLRSITAARYGRSKEHLVPPESSPRSSRGSSRPHAPIWSWMGLSWRSLFRSTEQPVRSSMVSG